MTLKQRKFCEEYVKCYNAIQAYVIAYDCSYETAHNHSYKNLHKPELLAYIKELQAKMVEGAVISAEKIAYNLDKIANDPSEKTSDRLKAYDLLMKQYGLQQTKINVESDTITINITGNEEEEVDG